MSSDLVDTQQRSVEARPLSVHETHPMTGHTMTEALDLLLQDYLDTLPPYKGRFFVSPCISVDSSPFPRGKAGIGG